MGIREGTTGREPCDGLDSTGCGGFQFGPEITKKNVVLTCVTCFLKVLVLRNGVRLVVLGELRLVLVILSIRCSSGPAKISHWFDACLEA